VRALAGLALGKLEASGQESEALYRRLTPEFDLYSHSKTITFQKSNLRNKCGNYGKFGSEWEFAGSIEISVKAHHSTAIPKMPMEICGFEVLKRHRFDI
jgi:hypothetical protein